MWKIVIGFIVFAALALFVLMKSDGNIDLTGEKHDVTGGHAAEPAASASPLLDGASAPIMEPPGVAASAVKL